jgi:hypothetical protein
MYVRSDLQEAEAVCLLVEADILYAGEAGRHLFLRVQAAPEAHILYRKLAFFFWIRIRKFLGLWDPGP